MGQIGFIIDVKNKEANENIDQTNKKFDELDKQATKTAKGGISKSTKGLLAAAGAAAALKASYDFLGDSINLLDAQEKAVAQLEATLKSTGNVAGVTSEELQGIASSLQDVSTFGDEAIIGVESLLLTFKNISGAAIPEVTEAILDVSTAMNQDLKSASVSVGKVLNDPIANLGALTEQGIQFTDKQKNMIKTLQESGKLFQAQKIILKELQSQFGGSAKAAADTFGGAMKQASNILGDAREELARGLIPLLTNFAQFVKDNKDAIISGFEGIGRAAEFAFAPFMIPGLVSQIFAVGDALKTQFADQAPQFKKNFEDIRTGLINAGVAASDLDANLRKIAGADAVGELEVQQKALNDEIERLDAILEKDAAAGLNNVTITNLRKRTQDELNKVMSEHYDLMSNSIFSLVKSADTYGITTEQIDKMRASLRGEVEDKQAALNATINGNIARQNEAAVLTEVQKAAELYGVSVQAATMILSAQNPEIQKIESLQKQLGGSLAEATKTYNILNQQEKERTRNLSMNKKPLEDNLKLNIDLDESLQNVLDSMDEIESARAEAAAELDKGFESEYAAAVENMTDISAGAPPEIDRLRDALRKVGEVGKQELFSGFAGVQGIFDSLGVEVPEGASKVMNGIGDMASGIMSKNPIKVIQGVIGSVSGLIDLFSGDGIQEAMDRENGWMDLSEGLSTQIHDLAEEIGDTHAATSLMFGDILAETELTTDNFGDFVDRQRELLIDMDNGVLSHKETIKELGETWATLVDESRRLNTEGSAEMIETLRNLRNRGESVAEVQEYINDLLSTGTDALKGYTDATAAAANEILKAENELNQMDLGSKEWRKANEDLQELKAGFDDIASQEDFNRAISYTTGFMSSFQSEGLSMLEIVERMSPAINNLKNIAAVGEFETGAITELLEMEKFVKQNQEVLTGLDTTKTMLEALGNTGYLSGDVFETAQEDVLKYFDELNKGEGNHEKALQSVAPLLAKELWYAEQNNLELSQKTKNLIAAAEQEGINIKNQLPLEEKKYQLMERQTEALEGIARFFGVDIPEGVEKTVEAYRELENQTKENTKANKNMDASMPATDTGGGGAGGAGPTRGGGGNVTPPQTGADNKSIKGYANGTGGWLEVTEPTMIMVGEGGENEYLNVVPESQTGNVDLTDIRAASGINVELSDESSDLVDYFSTELPAAIASTTGAIMGVSEVGTATMDNMLESAMNASYGFSESLPMAITDTQLSMQSLSDSGILMSDSLNDISVAAGVAVNDMTLGFEAGAESSLRAIDALSNNSASAMEALTSEAIEGVSLLSAVIDNAAQVNFNESIARTSIAPAPIIIPEFIQASPGSGNNGQGQGVTNIVNNIINNNDVSANITKDIDLEKFSETMETVIKTDGAVQDTLRQVGT